MGAILQSISKGLDQFAELTGRGLAWLALVMVLLQFSLVVLRYVFGIGSIFMQEGMIYLHATLFMGAAAYTLRHNGHVRVDVFYRDAAPRRKAMVNLFGTLFLLVPFCVVILIYSWDYVSASWAIREGSKETSGIHGIYLLKSVIVLFAGLVLLQGLSQAAHSLLVLSGLEQFTEEESPDL